MLDDDQGIQGKESRDSRTQVRRSLLAVIAAAGIVVTIVTLRDWSTLVAKQPKDSYVVDEFLQIGVPASSRSDKEFELSSKQGSVLVSNRFSTTSTPEFVLNAYQLELNRNHWSYRGKYSAGTHWGESYCKGSLLAHIEFVESSNRNTEYAFSVSWSGASERTCQ